MKVFNLIALALSGALLASFIVTTTAYTLLSPDFANIVSMAVSFLIGYNARTTTEKLLGYTLKEAIEEKKDE